MRDNIDAFIKHKGIAVVGVSDRKFGGVIYKTLKKRGYRVIPVNPSKDIFDSDRCYKSLSEIPTDIKTAVIAVSPDSAERVFEDAKNSSVKHLWFQQGKDFSGIAQKARAQNFNTVIGRCILMYTEPVGGIHGLHRFFSRLVGSY